MNDYNETPGAILNPDAPTWAEWKLLELWSIMGYVLGYGCGQECGYTEPYGFVPECSCPIHDSERWWHMPLIALLNRLLGSGGERSER